VMRVNEYPDQKSDLPATSPPTDPIKGQAPREKEAAFQCVPCCKAPTLGGEKQRPNSCCIGIQIPIVVQLQGRFQRVGFWIGVVPLVWRIVSMLGAGVVLDAKRPAREKSKHADEWGALSSRHA